MKKIIGLTGLAFATTVLSASLANAGAVTGTFGTTESFVTNKTATVDVQVPAIELSASTSELDFGTVVKPSYGTSTFITVDTDGDVDAGSTASYVDADQTGAEFTFTGGTQLVSIAVEAGAPANGLSLTNFTGIYGSTNLTSGASLSQSGLTGPGTGTDLVIGATLTLNNTSGAVNAGDGQTVPYTITFTYD